MTDIEKKLVINCETGEVQEVELTPEEISERAAIAAQIEEDRLAREAEAEALAALKASARAKLVAGQPLSAEEASVLVI